MDTNENREESSSKGQTDSHPRVEKTWRKKLLSFFASYVGLFVLLVLYVVGGAYLFYQRESGIEEENRKAMMEKHRNVFIS